MAFQHWQIGLDIQNGQLCALAIQRHRRYGWQLRHWWQQPLPADTLVNGIIQHPEPLVSWLQGWRQRLPRTFSLRVGIHPQLVLQRQLTLPEPQRTLREPERSRYITAAARRFFPIDLNELVLDYRERDAGEAVCLTAARKVALQSWLAVLQAAELTAEILELTPAALRSLADGLNLPGDATLVHRLADHWLWYSPQQQTPGGWCPRSAADDLPALIASQLPGITSLYISDSGGDVQPALGHALQPLAAFTARMPPVPPSQQPFALAAGLALRPED